MSGRLGRRKAGKVRGGDVGNIWQKKAGNARAEKPEESCMEKLEISEAKKLEISGGRKGLRGGAKNIIMSRKEKPGAEASAKRRKDMGLTTLCYIEKEDAYLMLHRVSKKHDVNKDKWIGVGGHFEKDESPEECLLREVKEETGLLLTSYRLRGVVTFICAGWESEYMFLYTSDGYEGEMTDCDEGKLEWVKKSQLARLNLWEGDYIFFRLIDEERPFFSLKLEYEGDCLKRACLDGEELPVSGKEQEASMGE